MKKGLYVILIFLVIVSITGIAIAARPNPNLLPSQGPIGDLKIQITDLTAENAVLKDQLMLCEQLSEHRRQDLKSCGDALISCKSEACGCCDDELPFPC
jgi:hypothetical protein